MVTSVTKFIRLVIQMSMMGIGGYLVLQNQMTGGGMIAASILAGKALGPFDKAIATWKQVLLARTSYRRLKI